MMSEEASKSPRWGQVGSKWQLSILRASLGLIHHISFRFLSNAPVACDIAMDSMQLATAFNPKLRGIVTMSMQR